MSLPGAVQKKTRILYSLYIWAMCVTYLGWINLVSVGLQGSPLFRLQDAVGAEHWLLKQSHQRATIETHPHAEMDSKSLGRSQAHHDHQWSSMIIMREQRWTDQVTLNVPWKCSLDMSFGITVWLVGCQSCQTSGTKCCPSGASSMSNLGGSPTEPVKGSKRNMLLLRNLNEFEGRAWLCLVSMRVGCWQKAEVLNHHNVEL